MEKIKFNVACKRFFGLKHGETLQEFLGEVRKLTKEDREEMAPLLTAELGQEVEL